MLLLRLFFFSIRDMAFQIKNTVNEPSGEKQEPVLAAFVNIFFHQECQNHLYAVNRLNFHPAMCVEVEIKDLTL